MNPLSTQLLKRLKIEAAISAEAESIRNLVPAEPGWDRLVAGASTLEKQFNSLLRAGFHPVPQLEALARKPGHGVRPVPYWGPLERVLYRALAEIVVLPFGKPDRSADAYVKFVKAPVTRSYEMQQEEKSEEDVEVAKFFFFIDSPLKYVVKSDITAFYQFIDLALLREELLLHGADYEAISALVQLLSETQGRSYGLPQLFDPSDWLSDIYIARVHRDLLRHGLEAWRFNDDFRIATQTYEDALRAIELLDESSRANGLVISEFKTVTYGMTNYLFDTLDLRASEDLEKFVPDEVETVVGSYLDEFEDDEDGAVAVLADATADGSPGDDAGGITLRNIKAEDVRILRRALGALARAADPSGVPHLLKLVIYVPSLTPSICKYLASLEDVEDESARFFDNMLSQASLNDWQRLWIINTMQELHLLNGDAGQDRRTWVLRQRQETRDPIVRSFASSALAKTGELPVTTLVADAESAPGALLTIYADAISACAGSEANTATQAIGKAWGDRTSMHRLLLTSPA